jgi:hypothetical protein
MEKLKKSIRLRAWTEENGIANDEYIKKLYIPSRWNPPLASNETEEDLQRFE